MKATLLIATMVGALASSNAWAQATVKPDGQWRGAGGLGLSLISGNTKSSSFSLNGDAVKVTAADKWQIYGMAMRASAGGDVNAELFKLGSRYDFNLSNDLFGLADLERNKFANLGTRLALGAGVGYHVIKSDPVTWDVFAGLGYASDRYINTTIVADKTRDSYNHLELLLGEESTHRLSATTAFKQRFVLYPNLTDTGKFRSTFDAGLSVAMSSTMNLALTLGHRYNSDPGTGLKKSDLLLFTGISVKYD
jgi:putative salt-induced outer membrane protein